MQCNQALYRVSQNFLIVCGLNIGNNLTVVTLFTVLLLVLMSAVNQSSVRCASAIPTINMIVLGRSSPIPRDREC